VFRAWDDALRRSAPRPPALSTEAMVLGRSALLAADPAEKEKFVAAGLDALFAAVAADPNTLAGLHLNPDFTPLRTHPTFATRLRAVRK